MLLKNMQTALMHPVVKNIGKNQWEINLFRDAHSLCVNMEFERNLSLVL